MNKLVVFVLIWLIPIIAHSQDTSSKSSFEQQLDAISGIILKKIETLSGFSESYELAIVQPLDHQEPEGTKFTQRVFISLKNQDNPVVFETHGYEVPWHKRRELSSLLNANQIIVEHRYFGASTPKPKDWKYLTTWQAASDHHRIIELLKPLFSGKWISTGKSKGGMASLFLKFYYPEDIDASLVFVAPIIIGLADERIRDFVGEIGTEEDREKIRNFQISCLNRRDELIPLIQAMDNSPSNPFVCSPDSVLEWSVIEFPYEFWWGNQDPGEIPDAGESVQNLFDYLNKVSSFSKMKSRSVKFNETLAYQQATELGAYGYDMEPLLPFLKKVKLARLDPFVPMDAGDYKFDSQIMINILEFLQNQANKIIYLYGENDIFTAASADPKGSVNSIQIIGKDLGHQFRIKDLSEPDRKQVINMLNIWITE